tara:strand:+ start:11000 stop:12409 length:1410 start_codon:yes stop_codon:yes gene_type:complete
LKKLLKSKEVSFFKKNRIVTLSQLTGGAFTKLLQSLLDGSPQVIMIPAYPLLYLPQHYLMWVKKYKNRLNPDLLITLILKHHPSLISTKKMRGYNGLVNLGSNKKQYLKINKKNFIKNLKYFISQEKISLENIFVSINLAYWKTKGYSLNRRQLILIHTHDIFSHEIFDKNSSSVIKNIFTIRDIIPNLSRRLKILDRIDKDRYDMTDIYSSKNHHYFNMLQMWFKDFYRYQNKYLKDKKNFFIKYESLKLNSSQEIKRLCRFLNIKFYRNIMLQTTFDKKKWWSDKIYNRKKKNFVMNYQNIYDYEKHFNYEFFCLEALFFKKKKIFNYKNYFFKNNIVDNIKFIFFNMLPTKYEFKNIIDILKINNILIYIKHCFNEAINLRKMKNYYDNAFYYAKKPNLNMIIIKYNFIRKFCFRHRNNKKIFFLICFIYLFTKIAVYPLIVFETFFIYLKRVFLNYRYYLSIKTI